MRLANVLRLNPPTLHNNSPSLRNRNIVVTRKEGANVYYSVSDKSIFKLLDAAKEIFNNHLVGVRSMLEEIHASPAKQSSTPSDFATSSLRPSLKLFRDPSMNEHPVRTRNVQSHKCFVSQEIPLQGNGCFATVRFLKGDRIDEYAGERITRQ